MNTVLKEEKLFQDRVRQLSEGTLSGVVATLINSIILVFVLDGVVNRDKLFLWFCGLIATSIIRVYLQHDYKKIGTTQIKTNRWKNKFLITLFMSGIVWGSAGVFLFPTDSIGHQVFIAFVLGGMVAGAVGVFSVMTKAFVAFSIPALFPIMVNFFLMGNRINYSMGTMIALFWAISLMAAIKQKKDIISAFSLKYENVDLVKDLKSEIMEREKAEEKLLQQKNEIEKIVSKRTIELHEVNRKLHEEIQEHQSVLDELQRSEEKYRLLAENVSDIIWRLNLETMRFDYISPSVQRVRGFTPEEAMQKSLDETLAPESLEKVTKTLKEELARDYNQNADPYRSRTIEVQQKRKNGSYYWAEATMTFLRNKEGSPVGILGVTRDISERKRAEKLHRDKIAAEASNNAKSEFLSTMSHELRTPLNHIIGFTELLLYFDNENMSEVQKEYLTDVHGSGKHLLSLVNDILDLSKIEAEKTVLETSIVDLKTLIEDALTLFRKEALNREITISTLNEGVTAGIQADERKLKQIMYNLLSNALKFTPDGGKVEVIVKPIQHQASDENVDSGRRDGSWVEVSVIDTGIGLQRNDLERIFNPFEQVDNSSTRNYDGTGLGLALTKKLVELHGGKIWVESGGEGKGSAFCFMMPPYSEV